MTGAQGWRRSELCYCSNVHPGTTLDGVNAVIRDAVARVRQRRSLARMGSGLWLGAASARALASPAALDAFRGALADGGLTLFTLNGFPWGDFHTGSVKERVYLPDWADPMRLAYTQDLASVLARCLPAEAREGTVSTLPLGYGPGWTAGHQEAALTALCRLARYLGDLRERTGRSVRVCVEMEPGCVLERTDQVVRLFHADLPQSARRHGLPAELLQQHLGVCFDVCHQAVMFEDPYQALATLREQAVPVGKIQLSSALEVPHPDRDGTLLAAFAEPRYLHQVRTRTPAGELAGAMDLPDALASPGLPRGSAWRVHFHLPVQLATLDEGELSTTQGALLRVMDFLAAHPEVHPHLEVEIYTWQVMPAALRPRSESALYQGLVAELAWVETAMGRRGLLRD